MNRTLLTVICVLVLTSFARGQNSYSYVSSVTYDETLTRDLGLIDRYSADPTAEIAEWTLTNGEKVSDNPTLRVFLYFTETPTKQTLAEVESKGAKVYSDSWVPPVGKHPYGFLMADLKASALKDVMTSGLAIRAAAGYRQMKALNDNAGVATGATAVKNEQGLTGDGVRLAVIDSGFDLDHPDFPQPIIALNYAYYPDSTDDVSDPGIGHGTHVAGSLFGNGVQSEGRWQGMAPGADPICIRIGDDNQGFSEAAAIYAIRAAGTWMNADIISMSIGTSDAVCDGSSPSEQVVDYVVSEGAACFIAAGNSAEYPTHYYGELNADESSDPVQMLIMSGDDEVYLEVALMWFDSADTTVHTDLTVTATDMQGNDIPLTIMGPSSTLKGTEVIYARSTDPLAGFMMYSAELTVTNNSDVAQDFHLKPYSSDEEQGMMMAMFMEYDSRYTVSAPASADGAIAVGAYVTRDHFTGYNGVETTIDTEVGDIASFSSRGPRIDGVLKPDICSPGQMVISLRDRQVVEFGGDHDTSIVSNDGGEGEPADYLSMSGTSMACPVAAGTAALLLEAMPNLTPSELREELISHCQSDDFTGETPNSDWGYGKISLGHLLAVDDNHATTPYQTALTKTYPNPFNGDLSVSFTVGEAAYVKLAVFDLSGREVAILEQGMKVSGEYHAVWQPFNLPSGIYLVNLEVAKKSLTRKVALLR